MKFLKGFGKNYFSFSAMTMYASAKKLQNNEIYTKSNFLNNYTFEQEDDDSPNDIELIVSNVTSKEDDLSSLQSYIKHLLNQTSTAPPKSFYNLTIHIL